MTKGIFKICVIGITALNLFGCATIKDVQRASDLVRADNELSRLLVKDSGDDKDFASLAGLAIDAKKKADKLTAADKTKVDAVGYYRIAATAFWKSGKAQLADELFAAARAGQVICDELTEKGKSPDRDCLYLQLVIPFTGLEQHANRKGLIMALNTVNFTDGDATDAEFAVMQEARDSLNISKELVKKILNKGQDDRYLTHPGMKDYFCRNAGNALAFHNGLAGKYSARVINYEALGKPKGELEDFNGEATSKRVEMTLPGYCN